MKTKNLKRIIALITSLAMIFTFVACDTGKGGDGIFKPGTYTGTGTGMGGELKVDVTFDEKAILSVEVKEHSESEGVADPALETLPALIVATQSTLIDVVAGATLTSNAIIEAVNDAIVQAGADPATLSPLEVEGEQVTEGTLTTDVVVVGGGLAGLSAAIKAAQGGAKVILVEKAAATGGSSALSGGGLGATDSSVQKENGITDTDAAWRALWEERQATSPAASEYPNWELVDGIIADSSDTIDWLLELGYTFRKPEGFGVDTVERLHFPNPEGYGSVLTGFLTEKAKELGVEIMLSTPATELVQDTDGNITGIIAGKEGETTINAKSVILASGGFAKSQELMDRLAPEGAGYIDYSVSAAGNTGDGIVMAEKAGAVLYEKPWYIGMGLGTSVPEAAGLYWYGTYMFVNKDGERFTNEADHYSIVYNDAIYNSPGGSYMLFDSGEAFADFTAAAAAAGDNAAVYKANTVAELAALLSIDPATLESTFANYNSIATGTEDIYGKPAQVSIPMETGPFYAVEYYPCSMGTFGGVKTTELGEVINAEGEIIKGLYAAGEMANRPYYNQVYMSGSALQVAATTGLRAGEAAAKLATDEEE